MKEPLYTLTITGNINELLTLAKALEYGVERCNCSEPHDRPMVQSAKKVRKEVERIWKEYRIWSHNDYEMRQAACKQRRQEREAIRRTQSVLQG